MKIHTGLTVIIAAALLLELTTGVLYYAAQNIIQSTVQVMVNREMNALYLCIRNKLVRVEATIENMSWVIANDLTEEDSIYSYLHQLVEHTPSVLGSGVAFVPNYFPEKGYWFEPYAVRRAEGTIERMQLGGEHHDYTQLELYKTTLATGHGHWCEPYMDKDGAQAMVTTYGVPVIDANGQDVGVVAVDISLDWLDFVMNEDRQYESTRRFLVTGNMNRLAGEDCPIFHKALEYLKTDRDSAGYVALKDVDGRLQHVFYTPVGGMTDWVLINVLDDGDLYGKLRRMRLMLLLPVMIGLLFAGFIVYRSSRSLERLRQVNEEKNRIGGELRVASRIQQAMLPPNRLRQEDVDIGGSLAPAREVGGDLYDYFIRDAKLFFCIGDVSGKGVPSAMLMSVVHSLFRSASAHENSPSRIMLSINETCCQGNESNMFVTLFVGVLDLPTGMLRYCDAGHDAPLISCGSTFCTLDCVPHLPVGVFDDVKYQTQETRLEPDSVIFLYTDGLTEAKEKTGKLFGKPRVEDELKRCADHEPAEILQSMTKAVHAFVGDSEQSDDLTMLAIRYTPQQYQSVLTETIVLKNDLHEVPRLNSFQKDIYHRLNLAPSLAIKLQLALEEAVVNVIDYAYPVEVEGTIEVRIMSDGHSLKLMITDMGASFDPTVKEKADTSLSVEDRQIGGLGILLMREMMDSINYERIDGKNVLTMIKMIEETKD